MDENVTVISGAFMVGFGERLDRGTTRTMVAGSYVRLPARAPHFNLVQGETVLQFHGIGPYDIEYVHAEDDPRRLAASGSGVLAAQSAPRVWELQEIELRATGRYANPYVEVETWVDLEGPDFSKRVYGFWDGGDVFRVRFVAMSPGEWRWTSGSNQPADSGLNGRSGRLRAAAWTEAEKRENPNRRGFLRATANGHALQYADGTPFFLLGDTWLGAATWRLPLTDEPADPAYQAEPGVTFQEAVALRKRQGFNSVSMIAAFPTWDSDHYPATYADSAGVFYRNAWEAFGVLVPGNRPTAKGMQDERGYRPFEILPNREGLPDYDRVVPQFFQSLDRKLQLLSEQGFVAMLETIRRDVAPPWKAYFDFDESFARFVQYMVARYGAYNMIFSKVHFDIYLPRYSITAAEFNQALNHHYRKYGPMPFGQPVTSLIDHATDVTFGTGEQAPWLTMHSTGNKPRDHGIYEAMERQFRLSPPLPTADLEPHYTGWVHGNNVVNGEQAESGSDRDNYFSRAQMYGCVLSGGLAGHVHGTGAYDVTSAAEPPGARPYFWQALQYESAEYMRGLGEFVLSQGTRYRDLQLASDDLTARKAPTSSEQGLDGWSFLMRTPARDYGLLYFENQARQGRALGWKPNASYRFTWFDPRAGTWGDSLDLRSDASGALELPAFPGGEEVASTDWAARILTANAQAFRPDSDLISLHYDHAPDLDDGHSAAADLTVLESRFGAEWLRQHVVAVSGTYGRNGPQFVAGSDAVMDVVWGERGGWLSAQRDRDGTVAALTGRWLNTLRSGGDIWVKEGGQSDITAAVVERVAQQGFDARRRIHVVQHSNWNEEQTTPEALQYAREHTDYIRIRDANAYLNIAPGDSGFVAAATAHPLFGAAWQSAFAYYDPAVRLDFSDTGELMHILGLGELDITAFQRRFLEPRPPAPIP